MSWTARGWGWAASFLSVAVGSTLGRPSGLYGGLLMGSTSCGSRGSVAHGRRVAPLLAGAVPDSLIEARSVVVHERTVDELLQCAGSLHPRGAARVGTLLHGLLGSLGEHRSVVVRASRRAHVPLRNTSRELTRNVHIGSETLLEPNRTLVAGDRFGLLHLELVRRALGELRGRGQVGHATLLWSYCSVWYMKWAAVSLYHAAIRDLKSAKSVDAATMALI